jgi:hypothetical protein
MGHNAKKIIQISALSLFFLLILIYAFSRSQDLIFGVKIENVHMNGEPAETGSKLENPVLAVTGNAKNAVNLTLNGREILINQDGDFSETIALMRGYNIINITAKDKFGYIDEKNYQLMLIQ